MPHRLAIFSQQQATQLQNVDFFFESQRSSISGEWQRAGARWESGTHIVTGLCGLHELRQAINLHNAHSDLLIRLQRKYMDM